MFRPGHHLFRHSIQQQLYLFHLVSNACLPRKRRLILAQTATVLCLKPPLLVNEIFPALFLLQNQTHIHQKEVQYPAECLALMRCFCKNRICPFGNSRTGNNTIMLLLHFLSKSHGIAQPQNLLRVVLKTCVQQYQPVIISFFYFLRFFCCLLLVFIQVNAGNMNVHCLRCRRVLLYRIS